MGPAAKICVRVFRRQDLSRILKIERASFGRDAWPVEAFEECAITSPSLFLVARAGTEIAGYGIACISRGAGEIASIAVLPRYRGRGVATALLKAMIRKLRRQGVRSISLMVRIDNADAIALYRRFGFVRTATVRGYYEDGASGWRMRLASSQIVGMLVACAARSRPVFRAKGALISG